MNEIDAIRERHSVRSYEERRIEKEKVELLQQMITECNEASGLHIQFVEDAGDTFNRLLNRAMGLGSAPSVIACVGLDNETLDEKIGYWGEKIVLYAQQLGLNTCWAGTYNPKNVKATVNKGERLSIVIAIGYGTTPGKVRKSKTVEQVSNATKDSPEWFRFGVEMALLAPTAINQQKFEILLEEDGSTRIIDKGGILSKIDQGIVKYHFETGANHILKN